jgi:hypothetical protein
MFGQHRGFAGDNKSGTGQVLLGPFHLSGNRVDSVFGLFLLTGEPRTGGGTTGGEGYVAVGIENLDS